MTISTRNPRNPRQRGYTLVEAMTAVVILAVAAAGVLLPFSTGAVVRAEGMRRTLAAKLASDLIEQIVNTPFEQIVSSYDGYSEPQGQVTDASGVVFTDPSYANFSRDVSCSYAYVPQQSGAAESNFIRITVRVYYRGIQLANLNRLLAK